MAAQLSAQDPTTLEFEAAVTEVSEDAVTLDETYFYAESGGQPADRGILGDIEVRDVQKVDDTIWHQLEDAPPWSPGETVMGSIDAEFRRYAMRAHTASHVVYGAARQCFDELSYGGFEITPSKVRIDLRTSTPIDDDALIELERLTNEVIWDDRSVTWSEWPTDEVGANNEVALNVATEVVNTEETVRVVEIEEWDLAACGGTHVASTGEIGVVSMSERSNPGEGLTRVEYVVGAARIEQQLSEKIAAWEAKSRLGVPIEEIPARIEQLEQERQNLEDRLATLEETLIEKTLTSQDAFRFEVDDSKWIAAAIEEVEPAKAASVAESNVGELADVIAISGGHGRGQLVVATDGSRDAAEIIEAVLDGFDGGGGGGSSTSAQAGGIPADAGTIIDRLAELYDRS